MEETTLVLIKPKGVQQGLLPEITSRLFQKGLKQVAVKTVLDNSIQLKWNEVNFKVDRIEAGPVIALVLEGHNAVEITRQAVADISVRKVHRSETHEQAQKEIDLWFVPEEMSRPNSEPEKTQLKNNTDQKARTVEGWHDLFIKCPCIADQIFDHLDLEEIYQLCEVCSDWNQAVHDSKKVQERLAETTLHKAAVEGWLRVAKLILARGDNVNERVSLDGGCHHDNHGLSDHRWNCQCDPCYAINGRALIWAPLHGAVAMGRVTMTHLLLAEGADVSSLLQFWDHLAKQIWGDTLYLADPQPSRHSVTTLTLVRSCRQDYRWAEEIWAPLVDRQDLDNDYRLIEEALLQHGVNNREHPETPGYSSGRIVALGTETSLVWAFRDFTKSDLDHSKEGCLVKKFNLK